MQRITHPPCVSTANKLSGCDRNFSAVTIDPQKRVNLKEQIKVFEEGTVRTTSGLLVRGGAVFDVLGSLNSLIHEGEIGALFELNMAVWGSTLSASTKEALGSAAFSLLTGHGKVKQDTHEIMMDLLRFRHRDENTFPFYTDAAHYLNQFQAKAPEGMVVIQSDADIRRLPVLVLA